LTGAKQLLQHNATILRLACPVEFVELNVRVFAHPLKILVIIPE